MKVSDYTSSDMKSLQMLIKKISNDFATKYPEIADRFQDSTCWVDISTARDEISFRCDGGYMITLHLIKNNHGRYYSYSVEKYNFHTDVMSGEVIPMTTIDKVVEQIIETIAEVV